ncbi:MAG: hypothetical protein WEB93_02505, partial [Sphingomonadales bacterium]
MIPLVAVLTLPLLAAFTAIAAPALLRAAAVMSGVVLTVLAALWLAFVIWQNGPVTLTLGGWVPPVGIALRADGLGDFCGTGECGAA